MAVGIGRVQLPPHRLGEFLTKPTGVISHTALRRKG
jgi:hypothetical protein